MTQRQPVDVVTGLDRTRRSMGDGTVRGRARIATPYDPRRLRRPGAVVSPRFGDKVGEAITVRTAVGQIFGEAGTNCVWVIAREEIVRAGFTGVTFPVDHLPITKFGYWRLDVNGAWGSHVRGGTVQVFRSGELLWEDRLPFWTHYDRSVHLGVCRAGEPIEVVVSPVGEDGAQPGSQSGTFSASLVLVEMPLGRGAAEPAGPLLGGYEVLVRPHVNEIRLGRRYDGESGTTILATASRSLSDGTWYWTRSRLEDNRVRVRLWAGSLGDEPGSGWDIDHTDADPNTSGVGWAGVAAPIPPSATGTPGQRQCDVFMVSLDGGAWQQTDFSEYTTNERPHDWTPAVSTGSARFIVRTDAAATGGKLIAYGPTSALTGEWLGWSGAGTGRNMDVVARVRSVNLQNPGILLRGISHGGS